MRLRILSILLVLTSIFPLTFSHAQIWKRLALDALPQNTRLGNDLAIAGDFLIVAASGDSTDGEEAGAVYVFDLSKADFPVHQKILRDPGYPRGFYGRAVEAEGEHLMVTDRIARTIQYFKWESGQYEFVSTLTVPNLDYGRFSYRSLALNGNWLFITAKDISYSDTQPREEGAVFLFKYENGLWDYHSRIAPEEWNVFSGVPKREICTTGNTLFVSSPTDSQKADQAGAVFVFKLQDGNWRYSNTLFSPDPPESNRFGYRIGCTENELVVYTSSRDRLYSYKIDQEGNSPRPQRIFIPESDDPFVLNIQFEADRLLIMTNNDEGNGFSAGAIHVYNREDGLWVFDSKIISPNRVPGDGFGWAIITTSDLIIVGAAYEDRVDEDGTVLAWLVGSVYVAKRVNILPMDTGPDESKYSFSAFELVYPNPAATTALLNYTLEEASPVNITILDILGRPIERIVSTRKASGSYSETIHVSDLPSGVYFYRISVGRLSATKPLTVVH